MIAIIQHGSHQFKVETGSIIDIDLVQDPTDTIQFDKILLLSDSENNTHIGKPYIKDAHVTGQVIEPLHKDEKVIAFKFKTKTGYKVKQGHRQKYTRVKITSINQPESGDNHGA
jgi:large subunit ribosomal protein L21